MRCKPNIIIIIDIKLENSENWKLERLTQFKNK